MITYNLAKLTDSVVHKKRVLKTTRVFLVIIYNRERLQCVLQYFDIFQNNSDKKKHFFVDQQSFGKQNTHCKLRLYSPDIQSHTLKQIERNSKFATL